MKVAAWVVGGIAVLILIMVLSSGLGVLSRTADPDNVIYTYEHFFDLKANADTYCSQIEQFEAERDAMVEDMPGNRNEWSPEDRNDVRRKETELTGVKAQRYRVVEQYNAESQKANTRIFKDNDLPEELPKECP